MSAAPAASAGGASLRAEVVRGEAGLAALEPAWRELNARARAGNLFLSPDWLLPWWNHFGAGRELRLVALWSGDELVGLLPLFAERVRAGGLPALRLAFLGDGATGCDYLDLLAAPGRELEMLEAALEAVGQLDWDLLDLDGLWRESLTALHLAQRFPSGRASSSRAAGLGGPNRAVVRDARVRFVCPHIPLAGTTWEAYLAGLPRRENLRRREKWLFRQPGVSIECARTPAEAAVATERFLELHRARWAAEGGSDGLADTRHEEFHRAAAQRLAERGELRMYTLFAARRPVASVYGVVHGGKFLYYQSGYDPLWASRSPGLVLLARTVQDALAEGVREFDFLRGNEGYKGEWARGERWTVQLRLWRGARGRVARAAEGGAKLVRESAKAAVGPEALEIARRVRRAARSGRPALETLRILRGER